MAHFTPPRAGTFMYHPHADEVRQQQAGLSGALIVLDSTATLDTVHDKVLLLTVPRLRADSAKVLINGISRHHRSSSRSENDTGCESPTFTSFDPA